MKKLITIVVLLFMSNAAVAQRMLPHQKGFEINTGAFFQNDSRNFVLNIGMIVFKKKGNHFLYALEYGKEEKSYRSASIKVEIYTCEVGYSVNLIGNQKKSVMLNSAFSALVGYEMFNHGKNLLYDGAVLLNESSWVYGAGGRISVEMYLSDRFVLIASGKAKLIFNTSWELVRPFIGFGLRINL